MNIKTITSLANVVKQFFKKPKTDSKKPREENAQRVINAVIGLIQNACVKLSDLSSSNSNSPTINLSSLEQNARRMLDSMESNIPLEEYAKSLIFDVLKLERLEIPLDRTNWERGYADINYFVLSVLYNGIAIPLYWQLLDNNGGSSNDEQRIAMIQWVIDVFGADMIDMVYADREFPSHQFLDFLINDNRYCQSYLELPLPDKFINAIKPYQTKDNSPFLVPDSALKDIGITEALTIIDTTTQLFLLQKLETGKYSIYPLIFHNQYQKLKRHFSAEFTCFKVGVAILTTIFKSFIHKPTINFVARCKSSTVVSDGNKTRSLAELYHDLHCKQTKTDIATTIRRAFGNRLYISARLNLKNEFVFLVSNVKLADPFATYKKRWNIELMFGKFKTLGFNLESTNITKPARLSAIMLLIGISYTCCCMIGEFFNSHIKPIKTKILISNDGTTKEQRLQYSKFKVGFDLLKNFINNQLFAGATAAQLLHKILYYDPNNPPNINNKSKIFKLIQTF